MAVLNQTNISSKANLIDARGPRFSAAITTLVLATALVTQSAVLIAIQLAVFAIGAFAGPAKTPYAYAFKKFVKPRLKGEVPTEDARPPQFAQSVGLIFAVVALAGSLLSIPALFTVAVGFALFAAFLNAAFNFCLGFSTIALAFVADFLFLPAHIKCHGIGFSTAFNFIVNTVFFKLNRNQHVLTICFVDKIIFFDVS
jgi:hypothetical protein